MFYRCVCLALCCTAVLFAGIAPLNAADFHPALSLQGYTGILNTPSAAVTTEGALYVSYSNQTEGQWRDKVKSQDNYAFSLGLLPLLEIGGRVVEAPRVARDLSANAKIIIPFIPKAPYLPTFAVGVQDVGGGARHLQNRYLVSSLDLWRFRLSAGYGFGPDRMEGVFGGAEFKAHDYLYLLGEYDTSETNLGIRLVSPPLFKMPLHLQATIKTSLDHKPEQPEFLFGMQIPLGGAPKLIKTVSAPPVPSVPDDAMAAPTQQADAIAATITDKPSEQHPALSGENEKQADGVTNLDRFKALQQRLTTIGFQNVRIGMRGTERLVLEYENPIFRHNELDGIGVVAGSVLADLPQEITRIELVLRSANIVIAVLEAPTGVLRSYLYNGGNESILRENIRIHHQLRNENQIRYLGEAVNTTPFSARLELYPGLSTYVATEVGVFDYLLSLRPDLYLNLWKGAVVQLRADIPLAWSDNFDDGEIYRAGRSNSRIDRALLHQSFSLPGSVMGRLGGGMLFPDTFGTNNEISWNPGNGAHSFQLYQALARKTKGGLTTDYSAYTAGYRYFFAPLDTSLRLDGGRFWTKDTGITVELKRFFGDVEATVFYKNSQLQNHGGNVQAGGITIALPLTFRKEVTRPPVQITGSNEWSYSQQSLIVTPGQHNYVSTSTGIRPKLTYNLARNFANRDRLSEAYIKSHLDRLRNAWVKYGQAGKD